MRHKVVIIVHLICNFCLHFSFAMGSKGLLFFLRWGLTLEAFFVKFSDLVFLSHFNVYTYFVQMGRPIMFTTTSHVITHVSLVTARVHASLLRTSVRSSVSAVQNVSDLRNV